jgi:hypothetical protein
VSKETRSYILMLIRALLGVLSGVFGFREDDTKAFYVRLAGNGLEEETLTGRPVSEPAGAVADNLYIWPLRIVLVLRRKLSKKQLAIELAWAAFWLSVPDDDPAAPVADTAMGALYFAQVADQTVRTALLSEDRLPKLLLPAALPHLAWSERGPLQRWWRQLAQ